MPVQEALVKSFHQPEGHFIVRADKRIRHRVTVLQPEIGNVDAVAVAPGAANDLHIFFQNLVVPACRQKTVQPLAAFRGDPR